MQHLPDAVLSMMMTYLSLPSHAVSITANYVGMLASLPALKAMESREPLSNLAAELERRGIQHSLMF